MPTRDELYNALRNADKAGDAEGARKLAAYIQSLPAETPPAAPPTTNPETGVLDSIKQGAVNLAAGAVRGAGSIGATILAPIDMAKDAMNGKGLSLESNRQRRADIDAGLTSLVGSDPNSILYKTGKLGGEVAGTAGVGGVLANGVRAAAPIAARVGVSAPTLQTLANSVQSGGMTLGGTSGSRLADLAYRTAGGAITGGASAALVDPEHAGTGAAVGAAFPTAVRAAGSLAGGVMKKVGNAITGGEISPEVVALADRAKQLGIDIPADRLADSKPLNAVAAGLNYVPLSGRAATEQAMQNQMNRALSATFGQHSANVTAALRKAQGDLGAEFDRVLQSNAVRVDQPFLDALAQAESRATSELGSDGARVIKNQIDEIMNKAGPNGEIEGRAAYNIKRTLDRIGRRSTPEAYYATDLKRDLMDALDRSMTPDASAAFAKTRQQYGNMLSLEKLAKNGADGDISIARLANLKNINNKDLQELADIAAQFLKPREGAHGAAQRATAAIAAAAMAGPVKAAMGMAAGRAANKALNSATLKDLMTGQPVQSPLIQAAMSPNLLEYLARSAPVVASD
ncbi:MAG TPA: hypothetical protein VFK88_05285 [Gallionella sp.]|nr:hypothetical protein [Gallionella sp.]